MLRDGRPDEIHMTFQREYAERLDWMEEQFKDWAFNLMVVFFYYEDKDGLTEKQKEFQKQSMAAFDDLKDSNDAEMIIDPWSNIISLKKEYHGIRVPGHKKSASVYRRFMPQLSDNWDTVAEKCKSARVFTDSIQLLHDRTD